MDSSDSEPEAKRTKLALENAEEILPSWMSLGAPSPFRPMWAQQVTNNFSYQDYVFSSDEDMDNVINRINREADVDNVEVHGEPPEGEEPEHASDEDTASQRSGDRNCPSRHNSSRSASTTDDGHSDRLESLDSTRSNVGSIPSRSNEGSMNSDVSINFSTSDDDLYSSSNEEFNGEFEVASCSDNNINPIEDANSSSEVDTEIIRKLNSVQWPERPSSDESDRFADGEEKDKEEENEEAHKPNSSQPRKKHHRGLNSSDSELSDRDKWHCTNCKATTMPKLAYCSQCFNERRNWRPQRPKRRFRKKAKKARDIPAVHYDGTPGPSTSGSPGTSSGTTLNLGESATERETQKLISQAEGSVLLSPPSSSPGSQDPPDSASGNSTAITLSNSNDSLLVTLESPSSSNMGQTPSETASTPENHNTTNRNGNSNNEENGNHVVLDDDSHSPMCIVCYTRRKDSAFVHGRTGHYSCCYHCADKIIRQSALCPVCRMHIERIIKLM